MPRSRNLAALATVLCCVLWPACALAGPAAAGRVRFLRGAESSFDVYTRAPSLAGQAWMRSHYARMRTYAPYFDSRLRWYRNAWTYKDAYAIYPGSRLHSASARFVLRDARGRRLYIPWGCSHGRCPQYAGDIADPAFRRAWIAEARAQLAAGYRGLYIDDVNLPMRVSDGFQRPADPIDRRTGRPMSAVAWEHAMARFMAQIRAAFPHAEIVHNSIWFAGDDAAVRREQAATDYVNLERGLDDQGLTGGTGPFAVRTLFALVDRLHAAGKGVIFDSGAATPAEWRYGLAGYFLVSDGRDLLASDRGGRPGDWWYGYDTDLGPPSGPRYDWHGLIRRDFARGTALLREPGSPASTVQLEPGYTNLRGRPLAQLRLGGASGMVLLRTLPLLPPRPAAGP